MPREQHFDARQRCGFTLVELVVAMAISTVLLASIASAIMLAARALPGSDHPLITTLDASSTASRIAGELSCALSFSERTPTSVTFTVADRDFDSIAETIHYSWSGISGQPLVRQYSGSLAASVLEDVREFQIEYELTNVPTKGYFLTRARVKLRCGSDASTGVETGTQVLNAPEVTGP